MSNRLWIPAVALMAAACSAGAGAAGDGGGCDPDDLACVVMDIEALGTVFGEQIDVTVVPFERGEDQGRWCDRVVPAPSLRVDAAYRATSRVDGSAVIVTVSAMEFAGADAEIMTTAVSGLPQGCTWLEGPTSLQILDELDTSDYGDELVGLLLRTMPVGSDAGADAAENLELVLVRRGAHVAQLALVPAQDDALLINGLLTELDGRLFGAAS